MEWKKVETEVYIDLEETLFSGQVFHFKCLSPNIYAGTLENLPIFLKQVDKRVYFLDTSDEISRSVSRFFNLDITTNLDISKPGLRFLTNDIDPTIFSFICSSNNNISRISKMVEYLYSKGAEINLSESIRRVIQEDLPAGNIPKLYEFPKVEALLGCEKDLRENGFGYRASYVSSAASYLHTNNIPWHSLSLSEARSKLLEIKGIGMKVADCICLIGLRFFDVVPIDTHILQYTNATFGTSVSSLSKKSYSLIQEVWKAKYGEYAGVAQLYAFKERVDIYRSRRQKRH